MPNMQVTDMRPTPEKTDPADRTGKPLIWSDLANPTCPRCKGTGLLGMHRRKKKRVTCACATKTAAQLHNEMARQKAKVVAKRANRPWWKKLLRIGR